MIFHPSAFESVRPKQALTFTHPVVITTTIPANNVYVPPSRLSFGVEPPVAVNSGVSQITSTTPNNNFVPLTHPRAPQTQTQTMSGPFQGAIPTDSSQKTNRPETVPMTSGPDLIITEQATLPQVPPTSSFIPEPQRKFSHAPRNSAIPTGGTLRRVEPNFVPMERATFS
jgi:hypothetical protein